MSFCLQKHVLRYDKEDTLSHVYVNSVKLFYDRIDQRFSPLTSDNIDFHAYVTRGKA